MSRIQLQRPVDASAEAVFDVIAHPERFAEAQPAIRSVTIVSETKRGAGTRFSETRAMGKGEATQVMEISAYEAPRRVVIVGDAMGTRWQTEFVVEPQGDGCVLTMDMTGTARNPLAAAMNWMVGGMMKAELSKDLDAVKAFCEGAP